VQVGVGSAQLALLIAEDHNYALQAAGAAHVTGVDGLSLSGTFGLERNTTGAPVDREIVVGDQTVGLHVAPGSRFGGHDITLNIADQQLSGGFDVASQGDGVRITFSSVKAVLGGGVVTATIDDGKFIDILHGTTPGVSADISGTLTLALPGVSFTGSVAVEIEYHNDVASDHFKVVLGDPTPVELTIAGQTLKGTFSFEKGSGGVKVVASNVSFAIAHTEDPSKKYLDISNASGQLLVTPDGVAASIAATVSFDIPGLDADPSPSSTAGSFDAEIQVNTTSTATEDLPAGPYIRIEVTIASAKPLTLQVGGIGGAITGSFFFQRQTLPGPDGIAGGGNAADDVPVTMVGMAAVTIWLGSTDVTTDPTLEHGEGLLVITNDGVAGYVSGKAHIAAGAVTIAGNVLVRLNTTGKAVDALAVFGGQTISVHFTDAEGNLFAVSASGLSISIANVVTIEGDVNWSDSFTMTSPHPDGTAQAIAGSNLKLFFGDGPGTIEGGAPNPLARGVLISGASVAAVKLAGTDGKTYYALDAQGDASLLGVPGVSFSGHVRVRVNTFTGAIDEVLPTADGGQLPLSVPAPASGAAAFISVSGTGLNLNVFGQSLSGDFDMTRDNNGITLKASHVELALSDGGDVNGARGPPFLRLSEAAGQFTLSGAGVTGGIQGTLSINLPGISLQDSTFQVLVNTTSADGGSVHLGNADVPIPAGPYLKVSGSDVRLTIAGQQLRGNFAFEQATENGATVTHITASNVTLTLSGGGADAAADFLSLEHGAGDLTISSAGISGRLSADLKSNAVPGFSFSAGLAIAINTTTAAVGDLPAGPYLRIEANGATITVAGQSVSANFAFEKTTDENGAPLVRVAVSELTASFADGAVSLTHGSGLLVLGTVAPDTVGGAVTTFTAARVSGTIAVTLTGVSLSGTLTLEINTGSGAVSQVFKVGGVDTLLELPAGPYLRLAGDDVSLEVLGQTLTGSFVVEKTPTKTHIAITGATLSLADGLATVSGDVDVTLDAGGIAATFDGTVSLGVPGAKFTGHLQGDIDTHTASKHVKIVTAPGEMATLEVAGQKLTAAFTFEQSLDANGQTVVKITVSNTDPGSSLLQLGPDGNPFIDVKDGSGQLLIGAGGVAGTLTISDFVVTGLPAGMGLTLDQGGSISVAVNTMPQAALGLPAGPYISVRVIGAQLKLSSAFTLGGDFAFDQQGGVTRIAGANVHITFDFGGNTVALTNGEGAFVLLPSGTAGFLSGDASFSGGGALSGSAHVLVRVNQTPGAVDQTIELGGRTIAIKYTADEANLFALSLSGLTFQVGDFVTIEGDVSFTSKTITGLGSVDTFAGDNLGVFLGQGPAHISNGDVNPLATGILLTNGRIGLIKTAAGKFALVAQGDVSLIGVPGVAISGAVSVRLNETGVAIDTTLDIPGSSGPGVDIKLPASSTLGEFQVANGQLTLLGQSLAGNFAFSQTAAGDMTIAASGVSLSLGGGAVSVSGASGALVVSPTGLAGRISGNLAVTVPNVVFQGDFAVAINSTGAPVDKTFDVAGQPVVLNLPAGPYMRLDGSGVKLVVAGQELSGNFSIERVTLADGSVSTAIAATGVSVTLGAGGNGVSLSEGHGAFLITSSGLAGVLGGHVTLALPAGVAFSGSFELAVNNTTSAVNGSFTAGGEQVAIDLPAGPYLRIEGTNVQVDILGQHLGGDFAFERASGASTTSVRVVAVNVSLSLGGGASPVLEMTNGHGALLMSGTGIAGSFAGTIALNVPGVTLGGDLEVEFNTTTTKVDETLVVAGVPVPLHLDGGPYVRVAAKNIDVSVLGQTLHGDFEITKSTGAGGASTVQIKLANVGLKLGGSTSTPLLTVTGVAGTLLLTPAGTVGSLTGTVTLAVPGLDLQGTLGIDINTTGAAAGGLPAGPFLRVTGTNVSLSLVGQTLAGNFTFEQSTNALGQKVLKVGVSDVHFSLTGNLLNISQGSGLFVITPAGLAGTISATIGIDAGTGLSLSGAFSLSINTTGGAVAESLKVGAGTVGFDLPAGRTCASRARA
jgi:hypothetical protein